LRPDDAFIIQQQALSLRFEDRDRASVLLQTAESMAPGNTFIKHSQATLLLDEAKRVTDVAERTRLLGEAERAFERLRARERSNAAPYVSLVDIQLFRADKTTNDAERIQNLVAAAKEIDSAFANCAANSQLLDAAGRVEEALGNLAAAEESYRRAVEAGGADPHVRLAYAKFLASTQGFASASRSLEDGLDVNPTDPLLNYELARCLERIDPVDDARVRRAYEYAVAEPVRGHLAELDLAIYLFRTHAYTDAAEHFANLRAMDLSFSVKRRVRGWIMDGTNHATFDAEVVAVLRTAVWVQVVGVPDDVFLDPSKLGDQARRGDWIRVGICFNALGPRAEPASRT
jgi:tetratricopeptide (TPR) repeat protein